VGDHYVVSATGGGSGNPVLFSIAGGSASVCSITGSTVSFDAAGTCVILADQAGDGTWAAAAQQSQSVTVRRSPQVVTFTSVAPTAAAVGDTYDVVAVGGGSANPVVLAIDPGTQDVCSIAGSRVTFEAVGDCTIVATQAGDQYYSPGRATQTVPVAAAVVDPTITAELVSTARPRHGWYRTPVQVVFTCTPGSAPLAAPCPAPVELGADGAGQAVTRAVTALDGGSAEATVSGIDIDRTAPRVRVKGAKARETYRRLRHLTCTTVDALSGPAWCRTRTRAVRPPHSDGSVARIRYRIEGKDLAGNTVVRRGWYRVQARPGHQAAPGAGPGWTPWTYDRIG
jgi:hypothetical protein